MALLPLVAGYQRAQYYCHVLDAAPLTSTSIALWLLLGLPAILALWTLARDLVAERQISGLPGQVPPRSRPDEVQTRAQMLAHLSR